MLLTVFYLVIGIAVFSLSIGGILFFVSLQERAEMEKRSSVIINPHLRVTEARNHTTRVVNRFSDMVHKIRGRMGVNKEDSKLKRRLDAAGLYDVRIEDTYIGIRILMPFVLLGIGALFTSNFVYLFGLAAAGFLIPDFVLERRAKNRLRRIRIALPDTVDLFVVCMDAGLGMDQAVQRTAEVLHVSYPELCNELVHLGRLQALGMEPSKAWAAIVKRTKSPDVAQVAALLRQSDTFGTPISEALHVLSDSLRTKRKQRSEEKAARSGVILLLPLVLFIFPVIFIVLLGPAALNIMHGFHPLLNH
jgi:tight adherence protein C